MMHSPEVELTEIFVSNVFIGNGLVPSDMPPDTKNTTTGVQKKALGNEPHPAQRCHKASSPLLQKVALGLLASSSKRWRLGYKPLPSKILDEAISLKLHNVVIGLLAPSF